MILGADVFFKVQYDVKKSYFFVYHEGIRNSIAQKVEKMEFKQIT